MKVSLITATNNSISQRTIESVIAQTNQNFEWIIVEDGQTRLHSIDFSTVKGFKLVTLWDNYGPSVARNVGVQVADGDIIAYLDSDDTIEPDRINNIIEIFTKFPETQLYFAGYKIIEGSTYRYISPLKVLDDVHSYRGALESFNVSIPLGVAHTKKPFLEVGGFERGIVCGEDGITWRRMFSRLADDEVLLSDAVAGTYFVNPDGQSRTQRRFVMGGFAFDASNPQGSMGQYLDESWNKNFNSVEWFEKGK